MRIGIGLGTDMLLAFTAPAAPQAPSVTAPADAATIAYALGVTVSADAVGIVDRIDWVLDPGPGETIVATDSTSAYSQTWTVTQALGAHTLVARAVRGGASTDSAPINITISDNPSLYIGATADLWLDAYQEVFEGAADAAEDGDAVAIWGNVGGSAFSDAAEATNKPDYRATGWTGSRPCIEFNGSSDRLTGTITGTASGDSWVVWIVCAPDLHNSRAAFDASDTGATNRGITHFLTSDALETFRWGNAAGNNNSTGDPVNSGTARVICLQGTTTSRTIYNNNTALTGGTNPETTSRAISAVANYSIGALLGALFFFDGKIAEVVAYKGTVTAQQRTDMQTRMVAKWAIP